MSTWIIVADSSRARFFTADNRVGPLAEIEAFVHGASRLREQQLTADGSGSSTDSAGYGRHSMGHEHCAREQEAEKFAHQLCEELSQAYQSGQMSKLYLIASAKFLGLMRLQLSKPVSQILAGEVSKDLVNKDIDAIRGNLPDYL